MCLQIIIIIKLESDDFCARSCCCLSRSSTGQNLRLFIHIVETWKPAETASGCQSDRITGLHLPERVRSWAPTLSITQRFIHPICSNRWSMFYCSNSSGFKHQHPSVSRTLEMNLTRIEWSLSGIHLVNFQGGRQAEFKSSKLVDDKLILLSVSLPWGDQNKRWNGSWEESGERRKSESCDCERKQEGVQRREGTNKDVNRASTWPGGGKVKKCD